MKPTVILLFTLLILFASGCGPVGGQVGPYGCWVGEPTTKTTTTAADAEADYLVSFPVREFEDQPAMLDFLRKQEQVFLKQVRKPGKYHLFFVDADSGKPVFWDHTWVGIDSLGQQDIRYL
jgi:hypothetical protein